MTNTTDEMIRRIHVRVPKPNFGVIVILILIVVGVGRDGEEGVDQILTTIHTKTNNIKHSRVITKDSGERVLIRSLSGNSTRLHRDNINVYAIGIRECHYEGIVLTQLSIVAMVMYICDVGYNGGECVWEWSG